MPIVADLNLRTRRKAREDALARIPDSIKKNYEIPEDTLKQAFADFHGDTVFRGDPNYDQDRLGHNLYPELAFPLVIAYCESETDVAYCLAVAREFKKQGVPFTCRGGGHSNAGYCVDTGIVIDVSKMNGIFIMPGGSSVIVGAGATLGALNRTLAPYNLHIPGGECDTVGVAGHSMGGGYGFTSRLFGLHCDFVISARLMLADGRIVAANPVTNSDLYWAVRGGTGNNFGVLLSLQYRTVILPQVWAFVLTWPIEQAADVMPVLQDHYMRNSPAVNLGYQLAWGPFEGNKDDERLYMMGMYRGTEADGWAALERNLQIEQQNKLKSKTGSYDELNSYLLNWYADPPMQSTKEIKQTNFVDRTLSTAEWQQIIDHYLTKPNMYDMVAFEIYGGLATSPGVSNAYVHREVDFDMFIDSFSNPGWPGSSNEEAAAWLRGFDKFMQNFSNTHKYQNYPNRDNINYRWNYWGNWYPQLLAIKEKYDPENFFTYQQSITPYPDDPGITKSTAQAFFPKTPIQYESFNNTS
ncbi:MAG: FAD-binding protein [Boseongicola sp.]